VRDLFRHKRRVTLRDIELLKVGRHFRLGKSKIIVGRNRVENEALLRMKNKTDHVFEVPDVGSPITILQGEKPREAVKLAVRLTAAYSDADGDRVLVRYGKLKPTRKIIVAPLNKQEIPKFRI
ncbi:MAG: tRNA 4-thiouridine(8) synthase ThiI, partial [Candidatus Freyarchaeota archaeon]